MTVVIRPDLDDLFRETAHEQASVKAYRPEAQWTFDTLQEELYQIILKHFVEFCEDKEIVDNNFVSNLKKQN